MLTDRDPNGSGRTSRASNMSAMSKATGRQSYNAGKNDPLVGPGVMSMLRTSTEMGNVVGLTGDFSVMGNVPRAAQRRGASSRLSTASSHSNQSSRASRHHRQWPSSSSAARHSMTRGPQYVADTLSPTVMNIPGSSPLIPRPRERDSGRSLSMTNTMQPTFRLSSNRSLGSLRHEPVLQRPRSPYIYPTRLRRPSYRPVSPVLSDMTGSNARRPYGNGHQGQPYYPGHMRLRIPSDMSLGQQERVHIMPRRPSRDPSPVYSQGFRSDMPLMPPLPPGYHHHIAVEQARLLNRSAKGSVSSGSTNLRTDSETPSSDMASPPTPKDGASIEVPIGRDGTRVMMDTAASILRSDISDGPLYYDYSEQFVRGQIAEFEVGAMSAGFVTRTKPIIEERRIAETVVKKQDVPGARESIGLVRSDVPDIAELPASPVARRITRDLIRQGLEPASTTEDMAYSNQSVASMGSPSDDHPDNIPGAIQDAKEAEIAQAPLLPKDRRETHYSILSQAGSSILDSSTLDFAVRYSIPMATETGFGTDLVPKPANMPASPTSPERSTEDRMSELLAGYQHTDSNQEAASGLQSTVAPREEKRSAEQVDKRSNHGHKPSDEQSFKSCTDMPDVLSGSQAFVPEKNRDAGNSRHTLDILPPRETPIKEFDAHSFRTAKDIVTPDRGWSMPPSRLSSSTRVNKIAPHKTSLSEMSLPISPRAVLRKPLPPRKSSISFVANKLRANSKPSLKQGSVSLSGSTSTLSGTQAPPLVPPRESSYSKEAQRYQAVASFLMRQLPTRMGKHRKNTIEEGVLKPIKAADHSSPKLVLSMEDLSEATASSCSSPSSLPFNAIKTPHQVLIHPRVVPKDPLTESLHPKICSDNSVLHRHSFSSPSPAIPEPSSVYSSRDVSLRPRVNSSPLGVPKSSEQGHRDSQTTTHLVWPERMKSVNISATTVVEPNLTLSNSQENTTTDLRLSQYRYAGPSYYLPDLKEESHEDSSLNTSASNLKHSSFRFSIGPPGVCASVDNAVMFSRRSSMGSHRRSAAGGGMGQTRELPSMQFSQMNLIEKLHEELGLRYSRSLEPVTKVGEELSGESPRRPASAGEVREKYRSLVADLKRVARSEDQVQSVKTGILTFDRVRSPEQLMAELNQLTIPSVGGLTARISEFFPSLKEYYKFDEQDKFPEEEEIMEHALEEIHDVYPAQKRSSARLRPLPGSPHMVVIEDDVYKELTGREEENGGVGRLGDRKAEVANGETGSTAQETDKNVIHPRTPQRTPLAELEAPSPVVLRPRALTVGHQHLRASGDSALSSRRSLRSFSSTPTATDTRPWNSDKNYPWATTTIPSVDISLPPPAVVRQSPRPGPSHLRNRLSDATTTSSFSSAQTATASPFGSVPNSNGHARRHRFSAFGRNPDQPHAVGERYPTSALAPPTAIFRDHYTASDTSEDEEFNISLRSRLRLRKRFSSARNGNLNNNTYTARSRTKPQDVTSPEPSKQSTISILQDRAGETQVFTSHRHTFRDAEGMKLADYHRHRIIDQLKRLWHKGGKLIRTISRRNRTKSTNT